MTKAEFDLACGFMLEAYGANHFTPKEVCDVGREKFIKAVGSRPAQIVTLEAPAPTIMPRVISLEGRVLRWVRMEKDEAPVRVTSWYRSRLYNKAVGGAEHSIHLTGAAADIIKDGMTALELALWLHHEHEDSDQLGIGYYPKTPTRNEFVHVDVRGLIGRHAPARWPQEGPHAMWWEGGHPEGPIA